MSYQSVRIDNKLLELLDILMKDSRVTFRSRSEFIHDAIREKVESYLALYSDLKIEVKTTTNPD